MTPDQIKDKFLYLDKLVSSLRDETLDCTNYIKTTQDEFLKINTLFEDQDKLEADLENLKTEAKKDSESKDSLISFLTGYADVSKKNFDEVSQNLANLVEKDQEILAEFAYLKNKFKEMSDHLDSLGDFVKNLKEESDLTKAIISDHSYNTMLSINSMKAFSDEQRKILTQTQQSTFDNTTNLELAIARSLDMFKDVHNLIRDNHSNLSNQIKGLFDKTQGMIDTKAKEIQNDRSSQLNDAVADLKKNFQAVQLDLQNSSLRTSNTSTQVQIIEKKIENIYLILKKLELGT